MKRTKNMVIRETEESRELYLYANNTASLYSRYIVPVVRNLAKKQGKGIFDADKAVDAFYPIACEAARMYCKEFARIEDAPKVFSVSDRFTCAAELLDYYKENIEANDI